MPIKYPVSIVHWVPCKDQLPVSRGEYLIALKRHYGLNADGTRKPYSHEETWEYVTDFGEYDPDTGVWTANNDWWEGQYAEIVYWAEAPDYPNIEEN